MVVCSCEDGQDVMQGPGPFSFRQPRMRSRRTAVYSVHNRGAEVKQSGVVCITENPPLPPIWVEQLGFPSLTSLVGSH